MSTTQRSVKHVSGFILSAIFFIIVTMPLFSIVTGWNQISVQEFKNLDRREPNVFPSKNTPLEIIPDELSKWFQDFFGFRKELLHLYKALYLYVCNDFWNPQLLKGKDGYVFLSSHTSNDKDRYSAVFAEFGLNNTDDMIERTAHNLESLEPLLCKLGSVCILSIPTKPRLSVGKLPELVRLRLPQSTINKSSEQKIIDKLSQNFAAKYILYPLEKAVKCHSEYRLIPQQNFHWVPGRYTQLVANSIADKFGISEYKEPGMNELEMSSFTSDIDFLTPIQLVNRNDHVYRKGVFESLGIHDVILGNRYPDCPKKIMGNTGYVENENNKHKILVIGNSFAVGLKSDLARHFHQVMTIDFGYFIRQNNLQDEDIKDLMNFIFGTYKPDYIVFQSIYGFSMAQSFLDKYQSVFKDYTIGQLITFQERMPGEVIMTGWSRPESWGVWSNSAVESIVSVSLPEIPDNDLLLNIKAQAFVIPDKIHEQRLDVLVNNIPIKNLIINSRVTQDYNFVIPVYVFQPGETMMNIKFKFHNATSPKELGLSDDSRMLSIGIESLKIENAGSRTLSR